MDNNNVSYFPLASAWPCTVLTQQLRTGFLCFSPYTNTHSHRLWCL